MKPTESSKIDVSKTFEITLSNCEYNPFETLKKVWTNNASRVLIGHLNISFTRNKFNMWSRMFGDNSDILMVSKTKLDLSFPQSHFIIEGYPPPFRYNRNSDGGGIFLFIKKDIPAKKSTQHL